MKYAVEMDPGATVYIQSFMKIVLGIEIDGKGGGEYTDTQTLKNYGKLIRLLLFSQNVKKLRISWY
jgi:hypothetical protein